MLNVMKGLSNLTGLYPRILFIFVWCYSSVTHGQVREQWDTDSGSQVIFIQSSGLPMVDVSVDFFAGAAYEPFAMVITPPETIKSPLERVTSPAKVALPELSSWMLVLEPTPSVYASVLCW